MNKIPKTGSISYCTLAVVKLESAEYFATLPPYDLFSITKIGVERMPHWLASQGLDVYIIEDRIVGEGIVGLEIYITRVKE